MAMNETVFNEKIATLRNAEGTVKTVLNELALDAIVYAHETGDIQRFNRLMLVVTSMNRKALIAFGQAFTGHAFNQESMSFGKKLPKDAHEGKVEAFAAFIAAGESFWSYTKELKVEASAFNMEKLIKAVGNTAKKLDKTEGMSRADMVHAMLASEIFSKEELLDILAKIA